MKKNISGKEALKIIVEAAKKYDLELKDKHFLMVYQEGNQIKTACVGFRYGKKVDMPVILYNDNVKTLSRPIYKVVAIFVKEYNEGTFNTCTYLSKGQSMDKLRLPGDIQKSVNISRASLRWELEKGIKEVEEGRKVDK